MILAAFVKKGELLEDVDVCDFRVFETAAKFKEVNERHGEVKWVSIVNFDIDGNSILFRSLKLAICCLDVQTDMPDEGWIE